LITFIEHGDYLKHKMPQILESPTRLQLIKRAIKASKILEKPFVRKVSPEVATEEELMMLHVEELVNSVKHSSLIGGATLTADTMTNEHTFDAASRAAGGAILAAETAIKDKEAIAYALTRPPGHHATQSNAMGFCFFNNIALGAEKLIRANKAKKIAIIDFDNHYGNGTADLFYDRSDILTISLHADPDKAFPYQGRVHEIGEREGEGHNICIPLPVGTGDKEYLEAFDKIIPPIIEQYNPDILMVAAGYDGLQEDPYGYLALTITGYKEIGSRIYQLAQEFCEGKIALTLEGGYKFEDLGEAFMASITPFSNDFELTKKMDAKLSSSGDKTALKNNLTNLAKYLKDYWKL
jgi:acetoin utilization deacetylase AcuC-like enzyme